MSKSQHIEVLGTGLAQVPQTAPDRRPTPWPRKTWQHPGKSLAGIWTADSLSGRFVRGTVWSLVGALVSQGASLAVSVITARLLGLQAFGQYGMIQSTVGMLGIFAGLGLGLTATKYVAEFRTRDPERAGGIIALSGIVAVVSGGLLALALVAWSPILATKTLNAPELADGLRIGSVLLFLNAINGAQAGALAGLEAFRSIAWINIVRGLTACPAMVATAFLWRLPGAIWGLAIPAAVACVFSQAVLQDQCRIRRIRPRWSSGWAERTVLWTFSIPAFLSGALTGPTLWTATTMLVNQPAGYAEMGVFSAATQWRSAIAFIPAVLAQLALPVLSNLNGEGDVCRYRKALRWNLILTALAATAVALPIALAAPRIMQLYGRDFRRSWMLLVLSAAIAVISCINSVVGTAILSAGSVWVGFAFNAMWATVFLAGCYWFIPANLALGLTGSMLAAYIAHTGWQSAYLRRQFLTVPRSAL